MSYREFESHPFRHVFKYLASLLKPLFRGFIFFRAGFSGRPVEGGNQSIRCLVCIPHGRLRAAMAQLRSHFIQIRPTVDHLRRRRVAPVVEVQIPHVERIGHAIEPALNQALFHRQRQGFHAGPTLLDAPARFGGLRSSCRSAGTHFPPRRPDDRRRKWASRRCGETASIWSCVISAAAYSPKAARPHGHRWENPDGFVQAKVAPEVGDAAAIVCEMIKVGR